MGVSINGGTPKWMAHNGESHCKWMIWGYPYFRKPPYDTCFPIASDYTLCTKALAAGLRLLWTKALRRSLQCSWLSEQPSRTVWALT